MTKKVTSRITEKASRSILANISEAIQLTSQEEKLFLSLLREKRIKKKTHLLNVGELCRYQSFVVKGCLKVYYLDEAGSEHVAKFAIENWWAFDIGSFFNDMPAFYGILAIEECHILQLSKENYLDLIDKVVAFERFYRIMLQNSYTALQLRVTNHQVLDAQDLYYQFQRKYPGLENRISQKDVASYLGITPVFLSMLRRRELEKH